MCMAFPNIVSWHSCTLSSAVAYRTKTQFAKSRTATEPWLGLSVKLRQLFAALARKIRRSCQSACSAWSLATDSAPFRAGAASKLRSCCHLVNLWRQAQWYVSPYLIHNLTLSMVDSLRRSLFGLKTGKWPPGRETNIYKKLLLTRNCSWS
jgi:hypothetical protein